MWMKFFWVGLVFLIMFLVFFNIGRADSIPNFYYGYDTRPWQYESMNNGTPVTWQELHWHMVSIGLLDYTRTTFYTLQGRMRNGEWVHEGAAACGFSKLGRSFMLRDRVFTCKDTGSAVINHVDLWFPSYEAGRAYIQQHGDYGYIRWLP